MAPHLHLLTNAANPSPWVTAVCEAGWQSTSTHTKIAEAATLLAGHVWLIDSDTLLEPTVLEALQNTLQEMPDGSRHQQVALFTDGCIIQALQHAQTLGLVLIFHTQHPLSPALLNYWQKSHDHEPSVSNPGPNSPLPVTPLFPHHAAGPKTPLTVVDQLTTVLTHSDALDEAITTLTPYLMQHYPPEQAYPFLTAIIEALSNALYHASGQSQQKGSSIALATQTAVQLLVYTEAPPHAPEQRITWVVVTDNSGTLEPHTFIDRILANSQANAVLDEHGDMLPDLDALSGRGLYWMWHFSDCCWLDILPNQTTRATLMLSSASPPPLPDKVTPKPVLVFTAAAP